MSSAPFYLIFPYTKLQIIEYINVIIVLAHREKKH